MYSNKDNNKGRFHNEIAIMSSATLEKLEEEIIIMASGKEDPIAFIKWFLDVEIDIDEDVPFGETFLIDRDDWYEMKYIDDDDWDDDDY